MITSIGKKGGLARLSSINYKLLNYKQYHSTTMGLYFGTSAFMMHQPMR